MFIFAFLFLWVVFWLVCAGFAAAMANARGRSGFGWFLLGVIFGPFALLVGFFPTTQKIATQSRAQMGYDSDC
jgi:hypothetical protein